MELIGERLRRFRLEHGLSKRAVANRLGVSVPTIIRWEEGLSIPNDYNRHKIERLLRGGPEPALDRRPRLVLLGLFDEPA
ncbi:TPA: XRE family transcriptional regulator [Candidatus Bipolaricaulota bacterium]|nr:XRE family transcriptional regulator [Candidatus Bipolaricaulota bacterium]HIP99641.1 XRE family transcriptional regulator [Candidatus Bipolaricaulota bacterium]